MNKIIIILVAVFVLSLVPFAQAGDNITIESEPEITEQLSILDVMRTDSSAESVMATSIARTNGDETEELDSLYGKLNELRHLRNSMYSTIITALTNDTKDDYQTAISEVSKAIVIYNDIIILADTVLLYSGISNIPELNSIISNMNTSTPAANTLISILEINRDNILAESTITSLTSDKAWYYPNEDIIISGTTTGNPSYIILVKTDNDFNNPFYLTIEVNNNEFSDSFIFPEISMGGYIVIQFTNPDGSSLTAEFTNNLKYDEESIITSLTVDKEEYYLDDEIIITGTTTNYLDGDYAYIQMDNEHSESIPTFLITVNNNTFSDSIILSDDISEGLVTISSDNADGSTIETTFDYHNYEEIIIEEITIITSITTDKEEYYFGDEITISGTVNNSGLEILEFYMLDEHNEDVANISVPIIDNTFSYTFGLTNHSGGEVRIYSFISDFTYHMSFQYRSYLEPQDPTEDAQIAFDEAGIALNDAYQVFVDAQIALNDAKEG